MKMLLLATAVITLLNSQARAAEPELSIDTKRMLAYGALAVMTGACQTSVRPDQVAQIKNGMEKAAIAQKDLTEAEFTDMMKAVGSKVRDNRDQICSALTPDYINNSLEEAAAGK